MEERDDFRVGERGTLGNVKGSEGDQQRSFVACQPEPQAALFGQQPWFRRAQRTGVKIVTTKTKTFPFTSKVFWTDSVSELALAGQTVLTEFTSLRLQFSVFKVSLLLINNIRERQVNRRDCLFLGFNNTFGLQINHQAQM